MSHPSPAPTCHLCHQPGLELLPEFPAIRRVTSDCQPWPAGGQLGVCAACGAVQKVVDAVWNREIETIYRNYAIYQQGGGQEQTVFAAGGGEALPRSERLLDALAAHVPLPTGGKLLDVGCGNGAFLRAFSRRHPEWELAGTEVSDKYQAQVEAISGFTTLYTGSLDELPDRYDLIVLIHVLEHVPDPRAFLRSLAERLTPTGRVLIEVPDHRQNAFELLIADHCTHFTPATLEAVFQETGLAVEYVTDGAVPKELTLVASRGLATRRADLTAPNEVSSHQQVRWLEALADSARRCRDQRGDRKLGVFGTAIAATWLYGELEGDVAYFVDEDPNRIGGRHLGVPILDVAGIPAGAVLIVPLAARIAEAVSGRIAALRPDLQLLTSSEK